MSLVPQYPTQQPAEHRAGRAAADQRADARAAAAATRDRRRSSIAKSSSAAVARVFTSTKAIRAPFFAITSTSPTGVRTRRSRMRQPFSRSHHPASRSPRRPAASATRRSRFPSRLREGLGEGVFATRSDMPSPDPSRKREGSFLTPPSRRSAARSAGPRSRAAPCGASPCRPARGRDNIRWSGNRRAASRGSCSRSPGGR